MISVSHTETMDDSTSETTTAKGAAASGRAISAQWMYPKEVLAILLIVGPDIIQKGLAQCAPLHIPVVFSFGWVGYSFAAFASLLGDGRLLPEPDYPCKVVNLETGHARENKSFLIGRLLRDDETLIHNEALVVTFHEAENVRGPQNLLMLRFISCTVIVGQVVLGGIPLILSGRWRVLLVTVAGSGLAVLTAILPQWRAESYSARRGSTKSIAVLRGNGTRHVMIIQGNETSKQLLDLEDLAAGESPRLPRPWETFGWFVTRLSAARSSTVVKEDLTATDLRNKVSEGGTSAHLTDSEKGHQSKSKNQAAHSMEQAGILEVTSAQETTRVWTSSYLSYLPLDFWATRVSCGIILVLWVVLLICVGGIDDDTWYLFAVGAIGSLQNAWVAAMKIKPSCRGLALSPSFYVSGVKTMDVLMDLERAKPGLGYSLLDEFFPAGIDHPKNRGEKEWWSEASKRYPFPASVVSESKSTSTSTAAPQAPENAVLSNISAVLTVPGGPSAGEVGITSGNTGLLTKSKDLVISTTTCGVYDEKRFRDDQRKHFGLHKL